MEDEDFVLVKGAGHWVQQEKPEMVVENLLRFLNKVV
jgi:pimeloyl-ACP methyl ester carboxylesterase